MNTDRLYDLAYEFKDTALWRELFARDLFAVRLSNGEIGYCCVLSGDERIVSFVLYIGNEGLRAYKYLLADMDADVANPNLWLTQDCIHCDFKPRDVEPAYWEGMQDYARRRKISAGSDTLTPRFTRYYPEHYPFDLTTGDGEEDIEERGYIVEALEAALEVSRRLKGGKGGAPVNPVTLGFEEVRSGDKKIPLLTKEEDGYTWSVIQLPEGVHLEYKTPELEDESLIAKVRQGIKEAGYGTWECGVVRLRAMIGPNGELPIVAPSFVLAMVDRPDEKINKLYSIIPSHNPRLGGSYEMDSTRILQCFVEAMVAESRYPEAIIPYDNPTEAFLRRFCEQVGIPMLAGQPTPLFNANVIMILTHIEAARSVQEFAGIARRMAAMSPEKVAAYDEEHRQASAEMVEQMVQIKAMKEKENPGLGEALFPADLMDKLTKMYLKK